MCIDNYVTDRGNVEDGYALVNVDTGIVEMKHKLLYHACSWAVRCENALKSLMESPPADHRGWEETLAAANEEHKDE